MNVLITGSSGLVGSALVEDLFSRGYTVQALQRNPAGEAPYWNTALLEGRNSFDAIVNLAGENVADSRWTTEKKEAILNSRIDSTRALVDYIAGLEKKPEVLLCASAAGFYGNRGDEVLDETSARGTGFLSDVCLQWERESARVLQMGVRLVNLRFGMVLSPRGGALMRMLPAFKMMMGGTLGSGNQYMSWVSIRDVMEIINFAICNPTLQGPVNVVSPLPLTNRDFTRALSSALGTTAFLKAPRFMMKTVFGQMADEMLLSSSRAVPAALQVAGYRFVDADLDAVLRWCIGELEGKQER